MQATTATHPSCQRFHNAWIQVLATFVVGTHWLRYQCERAKVPITLAAPTENLPSLLEIETFA